MDEDIRLGIMSILERYRFEFIDEDLRYYVSHTLDVYLMINDDVQTYLVENSYRNNYMSFRIQYTTIDSDQTKVLYVNLSSEYGAKEIIISPSNYVRSHKLN